MSVKINGIEYVEKTSTNDGTNENPLKIAILQRGFVAIGRYKRKNDNRCFLYNSKIIRKWGTTYGLGQLAIEGKQDDTILDEIGKLEFDYLTIVALVDCDESVWKIFKTTKLLKNNDD